MTEPTQQQIRKMENKFWNLTREAAGCDADHYNGEHCDNEDQLAGYVLSLLLPAMEALEGIVKDNTTCEKCDKVHVQHEVGWKGKNYKSWEADDGHFYKPKTFHQTAEDAIVKLKEAGI